MQSWTSIGATTWTVPPHVHEVEYLVVGGGGGGGFAADRTGGGGAGGAVRTGTLSVTPGSSVTIIVGTGGIAGRNQSRRGGWGGSSQFGGIVADGGGGGGSVSHAPFSGGGGFHNQNGNDGGGNGYDSGYHSGTFGGGGGRGAGANGGNGMSSRGGHGGDGVASSLRTGSSVTYGGGGGGGFQRFNSSSVSTANRGLGGSGGGGSGAYRNSTSNSGAGATNGIQNTGGGGGGGASWSNPENTASHGDGGHGGSGIVVIRYIPNTAPSVTTNSSPGALTATSATLSGNVTHDGGETVTGRGIAWGTGANPNSGTAAGTVGTGAFSVNISGLTPNTEYVYRAYAVNAVGTGYGAQYTFTTPKADQTNVSGSLGTDTIQYGLTTTVTATGGQPPGAYQFRRSGGTATVSFSGSGNSRTVTGTGVGSTTIQVRRLGSDTHNDSEWVSAGTLTVTQAPLTLTADPQHHVYGNPDPALTFTPAGTLYFGDAFSVISGVILTAPTGSDATVGTHTITVSGGTAANYSITHMNGTLTVTPRPVSGFFTVEEYKVYDDTTTAQVTSRSLNNLASWDTGDASGVFLDGGEANYDTKAVGTDKEVTLTGMSLSGDRSANYVLETMNTTTADIIPDVPAGIVVRVQPQETAAGQPIQGPPQVEVQDQWGNPVLSGISVEALPASLFTGSSTRVVNTGVNGRAVFTNLVIEQAGQENQIRFRVEASE